ncbi:MAG: hypothetical protein ABI992_13615 [Chthoniobacterales bacterium]
MGASHQIVDLRQLLAARFPTPRLSAQKRLETGLPTLDAATEGGLPQGAITELTSPNPSAGSALLLYQLLDAAAVGRYFLALIDGRDSFDPCAFRGLGDQRLRHLLWLRCDHALEAIKAADLLLRDGNFPLVVLDLVLNSTQELRKIPATSWYRLQRLVEAAPTAFLVLTRRSIVSSAQWKLELENSWQLSDLEQNHYHARLQIQVQRVQGSRSEMAASA